MYKFAEISKGTNAIASFGIAPFLPAFPEAHSTYCVDITDLDPAPMAGYIYDPEAGTFAPPPPLAGANGYIGDLALEAATGGMFTAENTELNVIVGQRVTVTGEISLDGQVLSHIPTGNPEAPLAPFTVSALRLPLLPTDLHGHPLPDAQPSMAVASIDQGVVTATWTPEFTGTYAITEDGINVRLPDGQKFRFAGLQIFVLPDTAQGANE